MASQVFWEAAFSSIKGDWETPIKLVNHLAQYFTWDLDVCASKDNICPNFYSWDGLSKEWNGLCWMNPPYGREIGKWLDKASQNNVVCLIPARVDTSWFQRNAPKASLIVFIRGRLKFVGCNNHAPFPSAFMVFGRITAKQKSVLSSYGWTVASEEFDEWLKSKT